MKVPNVVTRSRGTEPSGLSLETLTKALPLVGGEQRERFWGQE